MDSTRILIVEDVDSLRLVLAQLLSGNGYDVTTATNGEEALRLFDREPFPLVITDIRMDGMSGLELLGHVKRHAPDTQVVIITSYASVDSAVAAMRAGAYDYVKKPFSDFSTILAVVNRAAEKVFFIEEKRRLIEQLRRANEELSHVNGTLRELVNRDGLTGLYNHRYFQETLARELARAKRDDLMFSVVFCDIDHFKMYNDTNGHPEGDTLLCRIGEMLESLLRESDIAARYGGEEFVVLLPDTAASGAQVLADKFREAVAGHTFTGGTTQPLGGVTVSIGVAGYPDHGNDVASLIQAADQALYSAKRSGRNRVVTAPSAVSTQCDTIPS